MSSPFGSQESGTRLTSYSRKEKSLGVLCTNFLKLYNRDGIESIGLDDAATQLGVERRRIYDVVNILEIVGVVARKAKNQYSWKGFAGIPRALEWLKEAGCREHFNVLGCSSVAKDDLSVNENGGSLAATKVEGQENTTYKNDGRREKSLAQLTENFVKLFLCLDVKLITLDNAATALLGDANNSSATKVRRLYDITNVLSSINLIEKTHHPESRKQAFRWLGWRGKLKTEPLAALFQNESKKRIFGSDITNHCSNSKRMKLDSSMDQNSHKAVNTPLAHSKDRRSENVQDGYESEHQPKHSTKSFAYGPFSPVGVPRQGNPGNKNGRKTQDWESLACTFRPQYHNQALSDLFGHYKEAWKSWYTEVAGKEEMLLPIP